MAKFAHIERSVLSALLRSNTQAQDKFLQFRITSEMFTLHVKEFEYIQEFYEKYKKFPSKATFKNQFKEFKFFVTKEPIEYYCDRLVEREFGTVLESISRKTTPLLQAGKYAEAMRLLRSEVERGVTSATSKGLSWKNPGTDRFKKAVTDRLKLLQQGKLFLTPYERLNKMVIGFRPENVVVLAGRMAVGKTFYLLNFALHWMKQGAKVLFISKEMSEDEIEDRLDALDARINWPRFLAGDLSPMHQRRLKKSIRRRAKYPGEISVLGDNQVSAAELDNLVYDIDKFVPDIVIVDGVYQFDVRGVRDEVQKMVRISRALKRIAKARKVLMVVAAQQNRQAENKSKLGGGMGTLSWSDELGVSADIVLEISSTEGREAPYRILRVLKGRNAAYGEIEVNMKMKPCLDLSDSCTQPGGGKSGSHEA